MEVGSSIADDLVNPWEGRIFAVYKPSGITSFGVVKRIRNAVGIKRVGHGGTLDPFAEGVLVVGIGRNATRQLSSLLKGDKEYLATIIPGVVTDTFDLTGKVVECREFDPISQESIERVLTAFKGEILQSPPSYSAVKVKGVRAYKLARKGQQVEIVPRRVIIETIELMDIKADSFTLRIECSHGTYIRTLAHDIGRRLGCGAHLGRLVRTRVGDYRLQDCIGLDDLISMMVTRSESV